jgi:hypothetical protein
MLDPYDPSFKALGAGDGAREGDTSDRGLRQPQVSKPSVRAMVLARPASIRSNSIGICKHKMPRSCDIECRLSILPASER